LKKRRVALRIDLRPVRHPSGAEKSVQASTSGYKSL
jgi:hypothetical protein